MGLCHGVEHCRGQGFETALIDPGKPWQNGTTESFNGKFRDECLSLEWFRSRAEAKVIIETWRRHFNDERPHSSLGYMTPAEFVASITTNAGPVTATERTGSVHGGGVNSLMERFGRADRKSQRAPGARSAGGVVIGESRQGGVARRNPN